MSLGKGLTDQKHFCFVDLLGTVVKTKNVSVSLAPTGPLGKGSPSHFVTAIVVLLATMTKYLTQQEGKGVCGSVMKMAP